MEIAKIRIDGTQATVTSRSPIPAGLIGGTITLDYAPGIWDGLTKTVVFKGHVTKDVISDATVVEIPSEVIATPDKYLQVGVYGVDADGILIVPTLWCSLGLIQPGADPSGDTTTDPSLPVWAQIAERVKKLEEGGTGSGKPGNDGGYYMPSVTQPEKNKIRFDFSRSKEDMPAVDPVTVELPVGQGSGGNVNVIIDGETLVIAENSTATIENETLIL